MTRSKILTATVIASIGAILLAWAPSAAYAGGSGPMIGMAFTDEGFFCGMLGPDGFVVQADPDNIIVESNDNNNHIKLNCHFEGVPNSTGKVFKLDGILCGIGTDDQFVLTTNSKVVVTPDGEGLLTCFYRD